MHQKPERSPLLLPSMTTGLFPLRRLLCSFLHLSTLCRIRLSSPAKALDPLGSNFRRQTTVTLTSFQPPPQPLSHVSYLKSRPLTQLTPLAITTFTSALFPTTLAPPQCPTQESYRHSPPSPHLHPTADHQRYPPNSSRHAQEGATTSLSTPGVSFSPSVAEIDRNAHRKPGLGGSQRCRGWPGEGTCGAAWDVRGRVGSSD